MTTIANKKWTLKNHPTGNFVAERDAKLIEESFDLDNVDFESRDGDYSLEPDSVIIEVEALSVDAFLRTMLDKDAYHGSVKPGSPLPALGYGTVLKAGPESKFKKGDRVTGLLGATKTAIVKSSDLQSMFTFPGVRPSLSLGYLGLSGLTAYVGMFVAPPKYPSKGETVVVSAAAGACGSIAAQMAKLCGARVVGIAGGTKKKQFLLQELWLDGAVDYKDTSKSIGEQLDEQCPNGIDFFFDNVGGSTLDAVLERINMRARIVICGAISQYSDGSVNNKSVQGPSNYLKLAERSSSMTGFNVMHHSSSFVKAIPYLLWHYYRGNIKVPEHVENGIESFPVALEKLFSGSEHCGRLIIDVDGSLQA